MLLLILGYFKFIMEEIFMNFDEQAMEVRKGKKGIL